MGPGGADCSALRRPREAQRVGHCAPPADVALGDVV